MNTEQIQASYGRCLRQRGFISRFYERLLKADPAIEAMFSSTDWPRQQKALRRGISTALTFAGGSSIVQGTMDEMATMHARTGKAPVEPRLYACWIDSLVETVREFDQRMTPDLEQDWRRALEFTTDHFTARY